MSVAIVYATDTASLEDVVSHLREVEGDFVPALSSRTDIVEYATKLKRHARLCEAWSDGALVGLVAGYCNDRHSRTGFITSASVLKRCLRQGIGAHLVGQFLILARESGMVRVCLEVSRSQAPARQLYSKLGFQGRGTGGSSELMEIDLSGKANDESA